MLTFREGVPRDASCGMGHSPPVGADLTRNTTITVHTVSHNVYKRRRQPSRGSSRRRMTCVVNSMQAPIPLPARGEEPMTSPSPKAAGTGSTANITVHSSSSDLRGPRRHPPGLAAPRSGRPAAVHRLVISTPARLLLISTTTRHIVQLKFHAKQNSPSALQHQAPTGIAPLPTRPASLPAGSP